MEREHHYDHGIHYTWITENLAVGGFHGFGGITEQTMIDRACELFDIVVLCADNIQPKPSKPVKTTIFRLPITEHLYPIDQETRALLKANVSKINETWTHDKKMLCCCAMGAARSPLVAASVLMERGMSGLEAAELIREKRCFSNFAYYDFLVHGHDDYKNKWLPTFEQRREQYWRKKDLK